MSMKRKIVIPGVSVEVATIISTDMARNSVMAVAHGGEVIVIFFSREQKPSGRVMSREQAQQFIKELTDAHRAFNDDLKIAQMEKEFSDGDD